MPRVSSPSLLHAFQRLQWLSDAKFECVDYDNHLAVLVGTTELALSSLCGMLHTVLSTKAGPRPPIQLLNAIDALLDHLLSTIFSVIAVLLKRFGKGRSKSHALFVTSLQVACDNILGNLSERMLLPMVRAFWPLCQTYATASLGKGKEKAVDVRMELLAVVRKSILAMDELAGDSEFTCGVQNLKERIALEGIREMMAVFIQPSNARREEWSIRVKRLAGKDAVWVLCAVLHAIFGAVRCPPGPAGTVRSGGLLRDEVLVQMTELVRVAGTAGETERSMVLGVVESGWMGGLQARSQGWTEVAW